MSDRSYTFQMRVVVVESLLNAEPAAVWAVVGTMDGVNAELAPWLHMTLPAELAGFRIEDAPLGETAFVSWVCFAKVPFDRHSFRLKRVEPDHGFYEDSHSWLQKRWIHERTLTPAGAGRCTVRDRVSFEPRLAFVGPVVEPVVRAVFRRRHAALRRNFGGVPSLAGAGQEYAQ